VAGVTLLELVVVIAILSLMVGLVAPRFGNWMENWKLRSAAEHVAETLRDARVRAIYEQRYYLVEIQPPEDRVGQASRAGRVRMLEPVSGLIREYALPAGIRVDEGEEAFVSQTVRLIVSPSGGMEQKTLRLRNARDREADIHINLLLGSPGIEIVRQKS